MRCKVQALYKQVGLPSACVTMAGWTKRKHDAGVLLFKVGEGGREEGAEGSLAIWPDPE